MVISEKDSIFENHSKNLLRTGEFSDLTLILASGKDPSIVKVHKSHLAIAFKGQNLSPVQSILISGKYKILISYDTT